MLKMLKRWGKNVVKGFAWVAFDILGWMAILAEIGEGKLWNWRAKSAIRSGRAERCARCDGVILPGDEVRRDDKLVWHVENVLHFLEGRSRRGPCTPALSDGSYDGYPVGAEGAVRRFDNKKLCELCGGSDGRHGFDRNGTACPMMTKREGRREQRIN